MEEITEMGGRVNISIVGTVEERDTALTNDRIREQAERTDSRKEMGVIAEAMGIHPTTHTPNTDRSAVRKEMEVGRCYHRLLGKKELYGTEGRDGAGWKKTG